MTLFNDKDLFIGMLTGIAMHIVMWFTRIQITTFSCIDQCESLMLLDIPASLFYFFMNDFFKILFSLILGSLQWGIVGWLAIKFLKYLGNQYKILKK